MPSSSCRGTEQILCCYEYDNFCYVAGPEVSLYKSDFLQVLSYILTSMITTAEIQLKIPGDQVPFT